MDVDYTAWRFWFDVLQTVGGIALGIYVWWVNRKKAIEKRFAEMQAGIETRCASRKKTIDALERDRTELAIKMQYMPSHQDIQKMNERLDAIHSTMATLSGRLEGINRAVDLMNEFLLNQGKKD